MRQLCRASARGKMLNSRDSPEWGMAADDEPACALYRQRCRDAYAKRSHATVEVYRPTTSSQGSADETDVAATESRFSRAQERSPANAGLPVTRTTCRSGRTRLRHILRRATHKALAQQLAQGVRAFAFVVLHRPIDLERAIPSTSSSAFFRGFRPIGILLK